jgi:hypothetical protein
MPLKAGTKGPVGPGIDGYADSMAEAMEIAFMKQWPYLMGDADVPPPNEQMRLMFIAISQGVVNHLSENHDAIKVAVSDSGSGNYTGESTSIEKE